MINLWRKDFQTILNLKVILFYFVFIENLVIQYNFCFKQISNFEVEYIKYQIFLIENNILGYVYYPILSYFDDQT